MKKRSIITGIVTLLAMMNLTLTSNFSWGSGTQGSTVQSPFPVSKAEYLAVIELLKQQIRTNENQIKNAKKIHQSITGNRIQKPTIGEDKSFFIQDSPSIYPKTSQNYSDIAPDQFQDLIYSILEEEQRYNFWALPQQQMRQTINTRLKYSGIVDKAVSLQTFQDAENRFTQIVDFLNNIDKTKDLKEVFELQTRIKTMSAMLQNEYTKLQMVRNLSDTEETLIEIQKRKLYGKIIASDNQNVPKVRFN
ncbi:MULTISPECIES: type IV secretion system protein [unclassified Bartonella]|uniref:type IV secretion system protein n=1 Tax=unclassified Bartonella TaxID=2645622 RepID=UPI0035CFBB8D